MSNLEDYLESNYQVEEEVKKVKRKRDDDESFSVENGLTTGKVLKESEEFINISTDEPSNAWKNVETKEIVQEEDSTLVVNTEKEALPLESRPSVSNRDLESNPEITNKHLPVTLPKGPKTSIKANVPMGPASKRYKVEEPIYRDKFGRRTHVKPISHQQQRKKNDIERQKRIALLNRDEHSERLNQLAKSKTIESKESKEDNSIREEDPALMFNKSIKTQFEKEEYKEKYLSICGRKLFKDRSLYPANRYGLAPGGLWDGVDRGNGYERKWIDKQVEKVHNDMAMNVVHNDD